MIQADAERFQYRVGHGGFHATLVKMPRSSPSRLTYVYDVGAQPSKPLLRKAIASFISELQSRSVNRVDYIVISHIDEDHVNGLDDLLIALDNAQIAMGTVILPWLTPVQKLLVQAGNNHRQQSATVTQLTGTDEQADSHLRELGAQDILRVVSEPDQDSPDSAGARTEPGPSRGTIKSGANLTGNTNSAWQFIPLRLVPPSIAEQEFEDELRRLLRKPSKKHPNRHLLDPAVVGDHREILTKKHRSLVRKAMKYASAHVPGVSTTEITNWSSVALLSGAKSASPQCHPGTTNQDIHLRCVHNWLHTGDLPLNNGAAWNEFSARLAAANPSSPLCVMLAPHHGSNHSHEPRLYSLNRPGSVFFTTGRDKSGTISKRVNPAKAKATARYYRATVIELHN